MKSDNTATSCSEIIAQFAADLTFESIPPQVVAKVKTHLIDSIGVGMAGSTMDWCEQASRVLQRMEGLPESTVLGHARRITAPNAAVANGVAIACMDYDDTDYVGGGHHMSRSVIPAALAMADRVHASGKQLIAAITAGYETVGRVGASLLVDRYGSRSANASWTQEDIDNHHLMINQGSSLTRGFIPGLYGSAVVAGCLLGLNAKQIASAQGLVGSLGLYLGQPHREGTDGLGFYGGWSAHAGILAALWAQEGLQGPRYIYEGDRGMLKLIGTTLQDPAKLTEGLGSDWNSMNNLLKFYPAGHGTHHFIEALKSLIAEYGIKANDVDNIVCRAPAQRVEFHFLPVEAKLHTTPYTGRFSMPYVLARLLLDGNLGPLSFTQEKVTEAAAIDLARRVTYVSDETAWYGKQRGMVVLTLRDGRTFTRSSPDLIGFPNRPYTRDDVIGKFKANARLVLKDEKRLDALVAGLESIEHVNDVRTVTALTSADGQ